MVSFYAYSRIKWHHPPVLESLAWLFDLQPCDLTPPVVGTAFQSYPPRCLYGLHGSLIHFATSYLRYISYRHFVLGVSTIGFLSRILPFYWSSSLPPTPSDYTLPRNRLNSSTLEKTGGLGVTATAGTLSWTPLPLVVARSQSPALPKIRYCCRITAWAIFSPSAVSHL